MRRLILFLVLACSIPATRAWSSPLLDQAASQWMQERYRWAFTMAVREYEGGALKEVREERYDPSLPGSDRWHLVSVDGRAPGAERLAEWREKKAKKSWRAPRPLADYFDFGNAVALERTGEIVRYRLPLRNGRMPFFPLDRIALIVSVNRANLALEKIEARISEPYHVALGLARVVDVDLALRINPGESGRAAGAPAVAQPAGTARVVVTKLGRRFEYVWSDFKRVTPKPNVADDDDFDSGI